MYYRSVEFINICQLFSLSDWIINTLITLKSYIYIHNPSIDPLTSISSFASWSIINANF